MSNSIHDKKSLAADWFRHLRDDICASFEAIEAEYEAAKNGGTPPSHPKFTRTPWQRPEGGGGEISIMKGRVFEKVGVNISTVEGEFSAAFRKEIPGAEKDPRFWASGISLVAHLCSPLVPAAHFNTRMIVVGGGEAAPSRLWFGGGGDLNPMIAAAEDTAAFHRAFEAVCDQADPKFYPAFKDWCDEYFYIPHRHEARGVGGIFYDYLGLNSLGADTSPIAPGQFGRGGLGLERTVKGMEVASQSSLNWEQAFDLTKNVGRAFQDIYTRLIRQNMLKDWTEEQRHLQLIKRGRYAEYNLLYDRGTKFGLMTGGNPEAILMSLPPVAVWE
jgi:coproporphyrinogen III oxidase